MIVSWLLGLLALASAVGAHGGAASGVVFEDLNRNGVRDSEEPGIGQVRVSNGIDVVQTAADGSYRLEVGDESIVFITKPSGYTTPVNGHRLPQFYYIHQPQGSPAGLRYAGIRPTGPLPDSIDFPLVKRDEPSRFNVIWLADPQPQTDAELGYIRDDVITELIGTDAAFGMTMGDIMFDDLSLLPRYNALVAQVGIPWYNVPGNHELNFEAEDDRYALETFKRFFGPPYYAFEYADTLFVVLDNIRYHGRGDSDPQDVRAKGGYEARISEGQLEWLNNELAFVPQDKRIFLAMHAPLRAHSDEPENPRLSTTNRRDLLSLLAGRPNLYAIAGHAHTTEHHYFGTEDGFPGPGMLHHQILTTVSGSWWSGPFDDRGIPVTVQWDGTPNGYHILEVDGTAFHVRYKAAGASPDHQMRVLFDVAHHGLGEDGLRDYRIGALFDGQLSRDALRAAEILTNLFDGGPNSRVEYAIGQGPFQPMQRVFRADPYVHELFLRHADSKKSWVRARPSSHLFVADLPDDLSAGVHTVTVRAVDEFNRTHYAYKVLEIVEGLAGTEAGIRYPGE
ncbi:MAG: calcineurin-like phosphoesterase C-terminal domain-containing protein [Gammaproteobacteria bacterium]